MRRRLGGNNQILAHLSSVLSEKKKKKNVSHGCQSSAWQETAEKLCVLCSFTILLQPIYLARIERAAE